MLYLLCISLLACVLYSMEISLQEKINLLQPHSQKDYLTFKEILKNQPLSIICYPILSEKACWFLSLKYPNFSWFAFKNMKSINKWDMTDHDFYLLVRKVILDENPYRPCAQFFQYKVGVLLTACNDNYEQACKGPHFSLIQATLALCGLRLSKETHKNFLISKKYEYLVNDMEATPCRLSSISHFIKLNKVLSFMLHINPDYQNTRLKSMYINWIKLMYPATDLQKLSQMTALELRENFQNCIKPKRYPQTLFQYPI